jgi:transposase-like protein
MGGRSLSALWPEADRLNRCSDWIDLEFVEGERTPDSMIEVGMRLYLAYLSLPNTKQNLEILGVDRNRTAIHDRVQKANLQSDSSTEPNQIVLDETVIQVNDEHHWLYATVAPETNQFPHFRLFQARTTQLTVLFLRELREKQQPEHVTVLVDNIHHLTDTPSRLGLRFQVVRHGKRNAIGRIINRVGDRK